ncbi:MAG: TPM domain-containing protein [Oscillospiraceae bacterium]|nr:TPM domain-containing protein [Oscillospiraceae bacterium]
MIKKFISVTVAVFAAILTTIVPASAWSAGINDMAGLYSDEEIAHLEARQEEVSELTGWNIAVVTTDVGFGLDGVDACDFAEQYCYDTFGDDPDSVVYLIDLDYRWISMDGDLLNYFNSSRFDTMMDTCEDCYMDYKDVENLEIFYHYLEYFYNEGTVEYDPTIGALGDDFEDAIEYYDDDVTIDLTMIFGGFIAGLIGAAISVGIVLARYKTHRAPSANSYLNRSSVNMYNNQDYFVREYTTRTRIESSSSGGGSRSGGSRRSGGRSRGGGGRGGRR